MNATYRVRKQYPIALDIHWEEPKHWRDEEDKSWLCWPLANEAQMSWEVRCRDCGKWAHWIGVGSPFGDGEQYFSGAHSYCYWCRPRTTFSDEELRIVSREDWARKQTIEEIIDIVLKGYENRRGRDLPKRLQKLISDIRTATETRDDLLAMYAMLTPSGGSTGVTSEE